MKKIRTLIAHNDVNITNDIVKAIENLEYRVCRYCWNC